MEKREINLGGLIHIVTEDGRVEKRRTPGKYRKTFTDKDGYHRLTVPVKGKTFNFNLQRIIWIAFNGEIPEGMVVDHIDDDRSNNRLGNLQLLTIQQNAEKAGARHWIVVDPQGDKHEAYNLSKFCREHGLHAGHMAEVAKGYKNQTQCKGWICYERT